MPFLGRFGDFDVEQVTLKRVSAPVWPVFHGGLVALSKMAPDTLLSCALSVQTTGTTSDVKCMSGTLRASSLRYSTLQHVSDSVTILPLD